MAFCYVDLPGRDVSEQALLTETRLTAMGAEVHAASMRRARTGGRSTGSSPIRVSRLGGLHYLVNNAGIAMDGALWRMSDEPGTR